MASLNPEGLFCNPAPTRGTRGFGFDAGPTHVEKSVDSQRPSLLGFQVHLQSIRDSPHAFHARTPRGLPGFFTPKNLSAKCPSSPRRRKSLTSWAQGLDPKVGVSRLEKEGLCAGTPCCRLLCASAFEVRAKPVANKALASCAVPSKRICA